MYKVLLVEDEELIRKGLAFMTDWVALGCSAPMEASNGRTGLEMICSERPDIVITDVKMPLMDGIEMIRRGLELHSFECIIISGFDEFEYAQTAIRLGVSDYLLKPMHMQSLTESIRKVCGKLAVRDEGKPRPLQAARIFSVLDLDSVERGLRVSSKHVSVMLRKVRDCYAEKVSLKSLSDEMKISGTYLNQKFKEEMHCTFKAFLNRYRIQMAIGMLLEGTYKLYEISERSGFAEYRYFYAVFKKYVGCTPTEFYEMNRPGNQYEGAGQESGEMSDSVNSE